MNLSSQYLLFFEEYNRKINLIRDNLNEFKKKKNIALKKGIFASDEDIKKLEAKLFGLDIETSEDVDRNAMESQYIKIQKEKLSENKSLADALLILDKEDDRTRRDAEKNDMVQIYKFKNGDMCIGAFTNNELTGIGSYIFSPNDESNDGIINTEYIGDFVDGKRDGNGIFTFSNGNEYIGSFSNNKSNGIGKMRYNNGDEYIGNWVDGKKNGIGIYTWSDGSIYTGKFSNGKMDGDGSFFNSRAELIYKGEWKRGLVHGQGKYIWSKDKWYEGEFQQGQKHGEGRFYLQNNLVYDGTWKFDKPVIFDKSFEEILNCLINE